jgi:pimeloyl-ACP methyl ester carboxylesterase
MPRPEQFTKRDFLGATLGAGIAAAALAAPSANAAPVDPAARPSIVLVHGAFANARGWEAVVSILQHDGYRVIAAENPLESFAGDVAATRRAIDSVPGPVVLVGHSYGGAVITQAADRNSNVKALVYVSAIAPEAGEAIGAYFDKYPSDLGGALKTDASGFATVDPAKFRMVLAGDVPEAKTAILAVSQKPINTANFAATVSNATWKTLPSWYIVSTQDRALDPRLERFYAKRMGAMTIEIPTSHVPFLTHPEDVARQIEAAAQAVGK